LRIDLNADVGEAFGAYPSPGGKPDHDAGLLRLVTSASVAAGFHAGDPSVIRNTIRAARAGGAAVGAHPGFPDLVGFGRREMIVAVEDAENFVLYQIAAVAGIAGFIRERPSNWHGIPPNESVDEGARVREAVRSRPFWIVVVVLFFASIAQNGALTHLPAMLTDRGVSPARAATALAAMGGASLVGRFLTGWLLDRFFAPRVALSMLSAATVGTLLLASAHSFASGTLAAILIGLGMGGEADVTPYILTRYFGLRSFAMLYGFTWTAYAVAGAIGPVLMGWVFDATGSYGALLTVLAGGTLAAAALMQWLPPYGPPPYARNVER
jgi:predicted MFS family arabinose efflux permease